MHKRLNLGAMTPEQIAELMNEREHFANAILLANNNMLGKLTRCEGLSEEMAKVLNHWSVLMNLINETHAEEVERIASGDRTIN